MEAAHPADRRPADRGLSAFSALFGRRIQATYGKAAASFVPVALIVLTWLIAMAVVITELSGGVRPRGPALTLWHWVQVGPLGAAGSFSVDIGFRVDELTAVLLIVVTTIGHARARLLDRLHEPRRRVLAVLRLLNLFMFSMLLLVLADNFWSYSPAGSSSACRATRSSGSGTSGRARDRRQEGVHRQSRRRTSGSPGTSSRIWTNTGTLNIHDSLEKLAELNTTNHGMVVLIRPARVRRGDGQERPVPLHVWLPTPWRARPCLGPHPCRDDGQRGRLLVAG